MFARLGDGLARTILIRNMLNNTLWSRLLLLHAKRMLTEGGEIIIGSVIMSRTILLNLVSQCGLAIGGICSEYDEIIDQQKKETLGRLARILHSPPEGLLQRVVWRLRVAGNRTDSPELGWWLHSGSLWLADCGSINLNKAARHVIDQLTAENTQLRSEVHGFD